MCVPYMVTGGIASLDRNIIPELMASRYSGSSATGERDNTHESSCQLSM
jgi:hypothetical protein